MGTSKTTEGVVGLTDLFVEAFKEGMEISAHVHVQDFDSSSLLSLREHFPDERIYFRVLKKQNLG